ncbi:MAG: hypothetical protein Q8L48_15225 [Archangium sp.]|nr:hypothetical protein [Archangium sp.]
MSGVVFVACDGEPLIVGHATPTQSALVDGGVTRFFPTSMGDPFEVDAPVVLPDTGVSDLSQAFDGAMHLVAWTSPRGVMAVRYDLQGLRLDAAPIKLAPPGLAAGDTLVTPRQGGGFEVFSQGLVFIVERDGSTSLGEFGAGEASLFDVGLSSGTSPLRLVRSCVVEDDFITLSTIAVAQVAPSGNSRIRAPAGRSVTLPLASVLAVAVARLGDHDYVATISGGSTARVLELRVLPSGDEYGPPFGAVDLGTVIFSTPVMARDLSLQTVGDRVMLVWRDETSVYSPDDGGAVFTARLSALSVRPGTAGTFDLTGPSVLIAGAWLRDGSLVTQTTGTSVLVGSGGVLTSAHLPVSPPIFEVDPVTLAPGLSINADQLTGKVAFRGCSWDGEACLVLSSTGGQENGIVVGQRVPLGGAMIAATPEQALPGQQGEQGRPGVVCASTTCLVTWRAVDPHEPLSTGNGYPYDFDDVFRAVRVSKASGLPIDLQSLDLFPPGPSDTRATDAKAASTGHGFVTAEARCAAGALQIAVRVVPETGAPASPQVINFADQDCPGGQRQPLMIVADGTRSLIVEKWSLRMVLVGADGVAHARPSTLSVDWPGSLMDGVMVGDKAVVAFSNGPRWTTVVFDLTTGVDAVGLRDACPDLDCEFGAGRLVMRPGHPLPGWIHLAGSVNSAERRLTWTELDDAARPVGPPATLASGWAGGLVDVVADERGLAVLTIEARYPLAPLRDPDLNLVFTRFDSSPIPQPGLPARVIATGLSTFEHALASCGDGQWLTAYQIGGSFRPIPAGASPSRVIGRFVYEAP